MTNLINKMTESEVKTYWDKAFKLQINKQGTVNHLRKRAQELKTSDMTAAISSLFDDYKNSTVKQDDCYTNFALFLNLQVNK